MAKMCTKCNGKGIVYIHKGGWDDEPDKETCPRCDGTGEEPEDCEPIGCFEW